MTQQNLDFEELKELKEQFGLLNEKLEKQRIINEEMLQETMIWFMNQVHCSSIRLRSRSTPLPRA